MTLCSFTILLILICSLKKRGQVNKVHADFEVRFEAPAAYCRLKKIKFRACLNALPGGGIYLRGMGRVGGNYEALNGSDFVGLNFTLTRKNDNFKNVLNKLCQICTTASYTLLFLESPRSENLLDFGVSLQTYLFFLLFNRIV